MTLRTIRSRAATLDPERRRWLALAVVCVGYMAMILDTTIVNVALPVIQRDLAFGQSNLAWVVDAYLLTFGGFLLLAGRLGDLVGHKRVFLGGLTLFTLASLGCGISQSQGELIAFRAVQGFGAAFASAVVVAIIVRAFPEPRDRAKAMSVYTLVLSGGGSMGLLLGGVLTQLLDWHWIFFVNLPVGLVAFAGGLLILEQEETPGLADGIDVGGSLLVTLATMLGVFAIVKAPEQGWTSAPVLGCAIAALAGLALFATYEARIERPILPASILRLRPLLVSCLTRGLLFSAIFGSFFLGALFFQRVLGYSTIGIGLAFLPQTSTLFLLSAAGTSAKLMERFGPAVPLFGGVASLAAALVLLAIAPADASYAPLILVSMLLTGTGAGLAFLPTLTLAMRDVPPADAGIGSAFVNVATQLGAALGVAVFGSLATERTNGLLAGGADRASALLSGYHLGLMVAAGAAALALVAALGLPRGRPEPAPQAARA